MNCVSLTEKNPPQKSCFHPIEAQRSGFDLKKEEQRRERALTYKKVGASDTKLAYMCPMLKYISQKSCFHPIEAQRSGFDLKRRSSGVSLL